MDRSALIHALPRDSAASRACSGALRRGADFHVFDEPRAGAELVTTYRRPAEHVAAIGLEHGGLGEALADLEAWGAGAVRLGQVTDRIGQRRYQLFLTEDAEDVVASLWVHLDA